MTSIVAMMCPALTCSALGRPPPVPAANQAANAAAATEVPRVSTNRTPVVAVPEWTALHDGVAQFTRMSMASTALSEAFARRWDGLPADLARALDEITEPGPPKDNGTGPGGSAPATQGFPPATGANAIPGGEMTLRIMKLLHHGDATEPELAELAGWITLSRLRAQVAAAQIAGTLRTLTGANLIRQAAGLSADATAERSRAEATAAFALLESGLGRFPD
jgi:hypothetical protein